MVILIRTRRLVFVAIGALIVSTLNCTSAPTSPATAAVGCAGGVEPAVLFVDHLANGVPSGRYAFGYAWQTCAANEGIVESIRIKFQISAGSAWYDYTTYKCTTNSGPSVAVNRLNSCKDVGSALIRTVAKATVRGVSSGRSQSRTYTEVGTRPCRT
jgi:hypothetical protein